MKIQLIHPPIYVNLRAVQATRPSLPLGLAYVAASLREAGHEVSVLDAVQRKPGQLTEDGGLHFFGLRPEEIAEAVDPEAEAIGVTVIFSFSWPLARRIVQCVKERHPEKILIGGGEHFTGMAAESLRTAPLDYLVVGEGEATACELLNALAKGDSEPAVIPGLAFLRDGKLVETPRRPRIRDVDALPWPAWDLFDPKSYYEHGHVMGVDTGMTMPILATRGCPYACTYCSNAMMWGRRWFPRDPKDVVEEIATYHGRYGATNFPFHDLTAILKRSWIVDFCGELARRDLSITWQLPSGTRCEVVDEEVAELMQSTGGHSLTFAPESGSARTRKLIGKQMSEESLMQAVRASVAYGLNVSCFFVVGFPQDTAADLRQSVGLAFRLARAGVNDIALSFFFPIPGTKLYDELVASGRIVPSDEVLLAPILSMNPTLSEACNFCEGLNVRTLSRFKYRILLTFYVVSFVSRPFRIFYILGNVLRDRETCKLDIFLNTRKRRILKGIRGLFASGTKT